LQQQPVIMGRLKGLPPRVAQLAPRIGHATGDERARDRERVGLEPWRRWYRTARWRSLRMAVFKRDRFTCRMPGCGRIDGNTSRLVCDHVAPHHGDETLFWEPKNLQTLCKPCHDGAKQSIERRAR
jgi:5-methylcytosine-specific restriction protein A